MSLILLLQNRCCIRKIDLAVASKIASFAILYLFKEIYGGVANSRVSPFHRSEGHPHGIVEVKSGSPLCARGGVRMHDTGGSKHRGTPVPPGQRREKEATS